MHLFCNIDARSCSRNQDYFLHVLYYKYLSSNEQGGSILTQKKQMFLYMQGLRSYHRKKGSSPKYGTLSANQYTKHDLKTKSTT